ncbi:MAG TPA: alanine racemase, partial [Chloroflexota bacterium]|nr:alanine racemase [Chloroflexota bacterium]
QLDRAAGGAGSRPRVLVEVDTGMGRCGVTAGDAAVALARKVADAPHLRFSGFMAWEGHCAAIPDPDEKRAAVNEAIGKLTSSADAARAAGLSVEIVSCSGTGTYMYAAAVPGITEVQAGGGTLGDVHYRDHFGVDHETSLTILTTVMSRPHDRSIIVDGGFKTFGTVNGLPEPIGIPAANVERVALSAEHGRVALKEGLDKPGIGDHLEWIVGYSDSTVFMHDTIYAHRKHVVQAVWQISGRGKLQ